METLSTLPRGSHCSFFYTGLADFLSLAVEFFQEGLDRGEACTFYSGEQVIHRLYALLGGAGVNVKEAVASGQLLCRASLWTSAPTSAEEFMTALREKLFEPALTRYPWVRHIGDTGHMDCPAPLRVLVETEARYNLISPSPPVTAICAYDLTRLEGRTLLHLLQTHPLNIQVEGGIVHKNPYLAPEKFLKQLHLS